jgi:hypothetical protein
MLEIFPSAALGIPLWFDARNEPRAVPFVPLVLLPPDRYWRSCVASATLWPPLH